MKYRTSHHSIFIILPSAEKLTRCSLAAKVAALEPSDFQTKAGKYAEDLKYFTGLLYELRTLPTGTSYDVITRELTEISGVAYEDDRTVANLKLVDYLRQTNRSEGDIFPPHFSHLNPKSSVPHLHALPRRDS